VPAHQSLGNDRGTAHKSPDFYALPLCSEHHAVFEHHIGAKSFWGNLDKKKLIIDHLVKYIQENNKETK
jgi:hypothetical protein